jgi:hypothetical protein
MKILLGESWPAIKLFGPGQRASFSFIVRFPGDMQKPPTIRHGSMKIRKENPVRAIASDRDDLR